MGQYNWTTSSKVIKAEVNTLNDFSAYMHLINIALL